jgi:hypothetical protein
MLIDKWSSILKLIVDDTDKQAIRAWFAALDADGPVRSNSNTAASIDSAVRELAILLAVSYNFLARSTATIYQSARHDLYSTNDMWVSAREPQVAGE